MKYSHPIIIFNPHSGKGIPLPGPVRHLFGLRRRTTEKVEKPEQLIELIRNNLRTYEIDAEILEINKNLNISELTRQSIDDGADLIIAAGGDGTINAVVNGMVNSSVPLGIIPLGTSNVFSIQFNIPSEISTACEKIARGEVRTIDLGKAGNRYFCCLAGIGLDAYVTKKADSGLKHFLGALSYVYEGITSLFRYHFRPIELIIDNKRNFHCGYIALIGNAKYYGGNLILWPDADPQDGLLDIVIFKKKSLPYILKSFAAIRRGRLPVSSDIEYFKGKLFDFSGKGQHDVHVDGEYIGTTPITISVQQASLKIIA